MGKKPLIDTRIPSRSEPGEVILVAYYNASSYRVGHTKLFHSSEELSLSRAARLMNGAAIKVEMINSVGDKWTWHVGQALVVPWRKKGAWD